MSGELVDSNSWAETMAVHLEKIQWRRRLTANVDGPALGPSLPAKSDDFTNEEVLAVLRKLRIGKAAGPDDIPAEFWKTLKDDNECVSWLAGLCSRCLALSDNIEN